MAESHPRATILMIARDQADTVGGAVASLLAQDLPSRIRIIDDGSEDETWDRITDAIKRAGSHPHAIRTFRGADSMGPERLIREIESIETPYVLLARPEDRSRPERVARMLHAIESTGATVVASNRTRLGGSVVEHAGAPSREGSGMLEAREIAFHLGWTPTNLGTLAFRTDVIRSFPRLEGPRISEDLGPLLGFRGAILDGCYYLDETLVDFKESRRAGSLDVRSRETCREGLFANLIASRTGMLQDLRDLRRDREEGDGNAGLTHLEASLKGVLIELVERWTQAREELWVRGMRPCWVTEQELDMANVRSDRMRLRPRSWFHRIKDALVSRRSAA